MDVDEIRNTIVPLESCLSTLLFKKRRKWWNRSCWSTHCRTNQSHRCWIELIKRETKCFILVSFFLPLPFSNMLNCRYQNITMFWDIPSLKKKTSNWYFSSLGAFACSEHFPFWKGTMSVNQPWSSLAKIPQPASFGLKNTMKQSKQSPLPTDQLPSSRNQRLLEKSFKEQVFVITSRYVSLGPSLKMPNLW